MPTWLDASNWHLATVAGDFEGSRRPSGRSRGSRCESLSQSPEAGIGNPRRDELRNSFGLWQTPATVTFADRLDRLPPQQRCVLHGRNATYHPCTDVGCHSTAQRRREVGQVLQAAQTLLQGQGQGSTRQCVRLANEESAGDCVVIPLGEVKLSHCPTGWSGHIWSTVVRLTCSAQQLIPPPVHTSA
jgi:hypothetical protein